MTSSTTFGRTKTETFLKIAPSCGAKAKTLGQLISFRLPKVKLCHVQPARCSVGRQVRWFKLDQNVAPGILSVPRADLSPTLLANAWIIAGN